MIAARDLKHNLTEEKIRDEHNATIVLTRRGQQTEKQPGASATISRGPSPNRGASVPDFKAIGPDSEKKSDWLKVRGVDVSKQVRLSKLSHMRYQHPDLQEITTFLKDFGMHVVKKTETQRWYAGYGPDQYVYYAQQGPKKYLGGAFEVQTHDELEKALSIPGSKLLSNGIEKLDDAPGGGFMVTIEDPDGFPVNLVYGQQQREMSLKAKEKIVLNDEIDKPRQKAFQRFHAGPAEVFKLGHFGLNVTNFATQMDWYTRHFNLVPSDILYIPSPSSKTDRIPVALFAHINLGDQLTDHHTMFLTTLTPDSGFEKHVHHSSFEVHDLDTQFLGHQWLANKGYESVWGVGRHILGSQIFDYWWDTTGFMVEHYADGDLVNMDTPMGYGPAGHEGLAVWGPDVPQAFLD